MGHTYTNLLFHVVFSTKERRQYLKDDILSRLVPYVGGIIRARRGQLLAMSGISDHVHLLTMLHADETLSAVVRDVKSGSSKWLHEHFPAADGFAWQEGYSAFSVSLSAAEKVTAYINGQAEHHKQMTFDEELIALLKKHRIDYDPRYVFG